MTETAPVLSIEVGVQGMTCASCSARLERTLLKHPGVLAAEVQLVHERARIQVQPGTTIEELFEAVADAGFEPHAIAQKAPSLALADDEARFAAIARRDGWLLLASLGLSLPLVVPMLLMAVGVHLHLPPWVEFALATPVQFWLGARFYRAGAKAVLHGSGNMDLLVALGTSAAYAFSTYELLRANAGGQPTLYFEAAAVVITLVRLGKWFEAKAKRGTTVALRTLMTLQPTKVMVRRQLSTSASGFEDAEIGVDELTVGMRMVVRPGDRFAADALILEGQAAVDESMITGESLPVQRGVGQELVGGSLNVNGFVVAQVLRVGQDATLGKIVQMVLGAQAGKAEVQRLVDRISAWFVPGVLVIAVVTFVAWWSLFGQFEAALVAAVSVLVIACPCALGLATPTAIVAGTGAAAKAGILVRDIDTLEQLSRVNTLVFDKTGTLTEGKPKVIDVVVERGTREELLRLAASVAQASTHPLSLAIVEHKRELGGELVAPESFESHAGDGVSGVVGGILVRVGQLAWLGRCGVTSVEGRSSVVSSEKHGYVAVSAGNELLGQIAIADRPRESAKGAIDQLQRRGIRTILLSGDDEGVARALADELHVGEAIGRARPEDKQALVRKLLAEGRRVAMVGDGINDAPALAAADVGIAIGGGTQVAMQTANVVIMRPDLRLIEASLDVAQATFSKIRQNLFWAFIYNCIGIPLAATGHLSPMIAGLAMALSSVSVVSNSLLLRGWRARLQ